jgi:hypothetical protein
MTALEFAVAVVWLTTPADQFACAEVNRWHPLLAGPVRVLALRWEVLDPRESGHLLARADDFKDDLRTLQERFEELRTAPPLCEADRFPGRELVSDMMAFNRTYHETIAKRLELDRIHAEELRQALHETDQLHRVWNTVHEINCPYYYVTYRRQALRQLRDLIGEQAFYTGNLPPHVPLWRIPEAR